MSSTLPYEFEVRVSTQFLEEQSDKDKGPYVFAYTIEIENVGDNTAQLLSRHWIITDAHNIVQEVRGDGVVGLESTPTLVAGLAGEDAADEAEVVPVSGEAESLLAVALLRAGGHASPQNGLLEPERSPYVRFTARELVR